MNIKWFGEFLGSGGKYRIWSVVATAAVSFLVYRFEVPNPMMGLIIPVVFFSFADGYVGGALSGAVAMGYSLFFFSARETLFAYDAVNAQKVVMIFLAVLIIVTLVGRLKQRSEQALQRQRQSLELQERLVEKLRVENRRVEIVIEKSEEVIYEVDRLAREIAVSRGMEKQFGWTFPKTVASVELGEALNMWRTPQEDREKLRSATERMLLRGCDSACTIRLFKGERPVWCRVYQYPIVNADRKVVSIIGRIVDVDREMREKERLLRRSRMDPLTDLYNKDAFREICNALLRKYPQREYAMLFLDLDNFKTVNDALGHVVGDEALKTAARKLRALFADGGVLARFGGDEFCVFLTYASDAELRARLADAVQEICFSCGEGGRTVSISCSIGAASTRAGGRSFSRLLHCADQALYAVKSGEKRGFTVYEEARSPLP